MSATKLEWPPTEEQIQNLAASALNRSQDKDVKALVYWENDPTLMIFNPFHFAETKYIERTYTLNCDSCEFKQRTVHMIIGKED